MSTSGFALLGVPADLVSHLERRGITAPFEIQAAVIPDALAGHDVTGRAPTGAGKTLAFGIPLVLGLPKARRRQPTGLVLAPTRELAEQIAAELRPLAALVGRRVLSVYGGVGYGHQRNALDGGVDLVVACPGRLEDLLTMGALRLDQVARVVVDEADRMADMGFLPAVRRLLEQTATERQVLLFSATLDGAVGQLSRATQRQPRRHEVGPAGPDMAAAHHVFWRVERAERAALAAGIVRQLGSTMVFCRTRHGADRLARQLATAGVSAAAIHGGRSQSQRDRALRDFAAGRVTTLVATDVAARGVHVDDVAAVVHFDAPADAATYVHRSGRTARAGASGVVVSLVERGAERDVRVLQARVGIEVAIASPALDALGAPHAAVPVRRDRRPGAAERGLGDGERRARRPRQRNRRRPQPR